jgi:2-polyprenyl-6-hydroxyphenyl methylase/3-demethylubiquinone-9 3-methyltransferase
MGTTPVEADRFAFGANWTRFLTRLDEHRVQAARESLRRTLPGVGWPVAAFLDVGCGSGLFSLAARQLGARVCSFDFDPASVACTAELKRRHFPGDAAWEVRQGSVLDSELLRALGQFDVVYAWGSLHHTGQMWRAMENVITNVRADGRLLLSIYNDQHGTSRRWRAVKRAYNRLPPALRFLVLGPAFLRLWGPTTFVDMARLRPFRTWRRYRQERGMSPWRDVVDWVGGYPFEVATPEAVFEFYRDRGFSLEHLVTRGGGHGCNEFVFRQGGFGSRA